MCQPNSTEPITRVCVVAAVFVWCMDWLSWVQWAKLTSLYYHTCTADSAEYSQCEHHSRKDFNTAATAKAANSDLPPLGMSNNFNQHVSASASDFSI